MTTSPRPQRPRPYGVAGGRAYWFCWQGAAGEGKMALVYELMEGGSLHQHLTAGARGLTLPQRSGDQHWRLVRPRQRCHGLRMGFGDMTAWRVWCGMVWSGWASVRTWPAP
jgi:hypothetical protein